MRPLSEIVKSNREAEAQGVKTAVANPVGVKGKDVLSPERLKQLGLDKY